MKCCSGPPGPRLSPSDSGLGVGGGGGDMWMKEEFKAELCELSPCNDHLGLELLDVMDVGVVWRFRAWFCPI